MPDMNMQTYEELQRHQLVTEFDIQSQSELEDYQVHLENVNNPTQAQDNLIIGIDGRILPHWNESLDFDIWIKINISLSGKRGLLVHGSEGLNSGSSGINTFAYLTTAEPPTVGTSDVFGDNYIITGKHEYPLDVVSTWGQQTSLGDPRLMVYGVSNLVSYYNSNTAEDVSLGYSLPSGVHVWEIVRNGTTNVLIKRDGSVIGTQTYGNIGAIKIESDGDIINHEYSHVRKYTATEPTPAIGTPKNIPTALKSFGRAG